MVRCITIMAEGGIRTEPKRGLPDHVSRDLISSDDITAQRAFEQIVGAFRHRIYSVAFRITQNVEQAQDITQQTFLKAWHHRNNYDTNYSLGAWLNTIARRTALDVVRKKGYRTISLDQLLIDYDFDPTGTMHPESEASEADYEQLEWAIAQLTTTESPENIEILRLFYYADYSYKEIREALLDRTPPVNLAEGTIGMRLFTMRTKLKILLSPTAPETPEPIRPVERAAVDQSDNRQSLIAAIGKITHQDMADTLYRSLVQGENDETLASAFGISKNALAQRLSEGRKLLTTILGEAPPNLFSTTPRLDALRRRSSHAEAARRELTILLENAGRAGTVQLLKRHFIDGLSATDIARQDGGKENTVRQAIFRASQKLEERLATQTNVH